MSQITKKMWSFVSSASSRAVDSGSLKTTRTKRVQLNENGLKFSVHIRQNVVGSGSKPRNSVTEDFTKVYDDPFVPYEDDLFLGELSDRHFFRLNKFNYIDNHALILTKLFEPQATHLLPSDLDAAWHMLACAEGDGLVFYNRGADASPSQPHKHIQITPLTDPNTGSPIYPLVQLIDETCDQFNRTIGGIFDFRISPKTSSAASASSGLHALTIPSFPFAHAICPIPQRALSETFSSIPKIPESSRLFTPFLDSNVPSPVVASTISPIYEFLLSHLNLDRDKDILHSLEHKDPRLPVLTADRFQSVSSLHESASPPPKSIRYMTLSPLVASYNFLMTSKWIMLVPRAKESHLGVGLNAMGLVGNFLLNSQSHLEEVQSHGFGKFLAVIAPPYQVD